MPPATFYLETLMNDDDYTDKLVRFLDGVPGFDDYLAALDRAEDEMALWLRRTGLAPADLPTAPEALPSDCPLRQLNLSSAQACAVLYKARGGGYVDRRVPSRVLARK
jgi:hypothetical protein